VTATALQFRVLASHIESSINHKQSQIWLGYLCCPLISSSGVVHGSGYLHCIRRWDPIGTIVLRFDSTEIYAPIVGCRCLIGLNGKASAALNRSTQRPPLVCSALVTKTGCYIVPNLRSIDVAERGACCCLTHSAVPGPICRAVYLNILPSFGKSGAPLYAWLPGLYAIVRHVASLSYSSSWLTRPKMPSCPICWLSFTWPGVKASVPFSDELTERGLLYSRCHAFRRQRACHWYE